MPRALPRPGRRIEENHVPGTNLTRDEAVERARILTVDRYDITLDLPVDQDTFSSTTTVRFSCDEPGVTTFIDLIAPRVHRILLNGTELDPARVVSPGRIELPDLAADNELTVTADCSYMQTGEGLHRFVDPVDEETYLYSQFEVADARRVFTCFDQPDLKGSFTFTVTAPEHWQVISVSPTPEPDRAPRSDPAPTGRATWRFDPTPRVSTYVTAIVAGPYARFDSELTSRDGRVIPLGVYARASLAEHVDAENIWDVTRAGFEHYEELFDVPYPFAKYDQLFVPEFNAGAMENAGTVTITEHYVFRSRVPEAMVERRALTVLHELAHMWFGDLVTMRWWDDLWLNESFAEYASTRCQAETTRWRTAWTTFSAAEKSWAYRQDQLSSTHPIVSDIRDLADVEVNFDGITYAKGASVLKQLVHWVGQDAFDDALRNYFATHAWGNTTLADLLAELSTASGRDLGSWAELWLGTAGVATLHPELERAQDGTLASVSIRQEAPAGYPTLRPHRLAVGCYDMVDGALRRVRRVELDVTGERTEVPELIGVPGPDLFLVNDDDLAYAKIRIDPVSMATAVRHLSDFADPLAGALVWGAAWDMTRDAELGAREFVELVVNNIDSVGDPSVAQTLLRQLASTLRFYVAPEFRDEARTGMAERLATLLREADPGGDAQLRYARSLAAHATDAASLSLVRALWDGTEQIPGLAVDTEMRWALLTALVAGGSAGVEEIDAELARDDTATGRVHAETARAAVPTPRAKAEAWARVMDGSDLPNTVQAAVIAGFTRTDDPELVAPFVEPYFAGITRVWRERTSEMASQIVTGLYPVQLASRELLARTDLWTSETPVEPALRRLVQEGRDSAVRAVAAQDRDRTPVLPVSG
jgi:aminopeptidase N